MPRTRKETPEEEEEEEWTWKDGIQDEEYNGHSKEPPPTEHTAVSNGSKIFRVGDIAQFNGADGFKWVGVIRGFETQYIRGQGAEMKVMAQWFSRQHDILQKRKRKGAPAVRTFSFFRDG